MKRILALALFTFLGIKASAQGDGVADNHQITVTVPTIALLDLEATSSKDFSATFVQPTPLEAGQKITNPANNTSVWLNYSSILPLTGVTTRRVAVKVNAVVPGVDISVVAGTATTGAGTRGTPGAAVTLTTADQNLITGIGSAYTATGVSNGHNLTYSFAAADGNYANLRGSSPVITVTYTLIDVN